SFRKLECYERAKARAPTRPVANHERDVARGAARKFETLVEQSQERLPGPNLVSGGRSSNAEMERKAWVVSMGHQCDRLRCHRSVVHLVSLPSMRPSG